MAADLIQIKWIGKGFIFPLTLSADSSYQVGPIQSQLFGFAARPKIFGLEKNCPFGRLDEGFSTQFSTSQTTCNYSGVISSIENCTRAVRVDDFNKMIPFSTSSTSHIH